MDDLSPFFESRDTRVNRLPETVRNTFSVAEQEATKAGDTQFADKQFSSLWLSKRLGLPKKQVADNFDAIAGRFFGPGVTPSGAYDQISKTFEFAGGEGEGTDGTQTPTEEYSPVGGMPKAPANTFLYKAEQAARSIPSGAAKIGYMGLAAAHSQEASFIGGPTMPQAPDPMSDGEYATLARRNKEMEDPYQFSSVRDEEGSYFNPAAYDPQLEANEKRMRGIRTRLDKEHIVNMRAWSKATEDFESENPERAEKAKQVRKNSDTLYEMAEEMNHYYGIDPEFAETTLGKFAQMAGGVPATAVLGMMGPGGLAAMESVFFGEAEMDQKRAIEEQGGTYDPQQGVATNLASAVPQMILERYVGIEKVLASAMKATAKVGGKVMFGDYLKNVGKRVVESSIGEAWTEPAQGAWGDMIASLTYDEKRMIITGDAAERRLFEMVAGATMGALFGGPIAIAESMDSAAATKAEGAMVVAKDGNPLTGPEFNALRKIKSDEELMASAPDAESGKLLVAAVNGDVVAQREYNKKLINEQFTATEGMEAAGMTLGNVKGVPVLKDKEGNIFAINLSNQEHVQFLERFKAQVSKKAAQEVANELTKRFDDETKVIEFEEEERTMGDFIDAGLADIKKAEERMKIAIENGANIPEGTNPRDMVVLGNNITEYRNNVETDVSKIWRGGNAFTVIEEVSEGYVKKRLKIGDLSLDELQSWRTEYDAKAGIAPGTNSKQGLVEWFSARVVDYAVSNRKADNMPKSWGGFLRMLGDHLRQVMKMAAKMTKMQRDGKLNTELEQALKGALGLTPKAEAVAAAVDRGRAKKQAELEEVFAMIKPEAAERESLENYQRLKHKLSREEELTAIMLQRAQAEIEPVYGITAEISVQAQRILDEEGYGDVSFSVAPATNSVAFKKWFGDSKVVDADGKPKVVVHGNVFSADGGISSFDVSEQRFGKAGYGFYFSDITGANLFTEYGQRFQSNQSYRGEPNQPKSIPVYLSIKNPLVVDHVDDLARYIEKGQTFGAARGFSGNISPTAKLDLQRQGYDGIITRETTAKKVHKTQGLKILDRDDPKAISFPVYVAFEPTQIKSATGNRGTYDPVDPDITFSVGSPAFNKWFGDSKVVNDAGKPKVVYHGTSSSFAEFNKSRQGDGPSSSQFEGREGFFFTTNPLEAEDSAFEAGIWDARANARENIVPVYLRITNPYVRKSGGKWPQSFYDQSWQDIQDKAKRGGHDGIVVTGTGKAAGTSMFVVFEPTQIKSATGNRGTYDPANPDITFSVGDSDGQPDGTGAQRTPRYDKGTTGDSQPANARRTTGDTGTDGAERYGSGVLTPLEGAPAIEGATGPDLNLVSVVEEYAKSLGLPLHRQAEFVHVDKDRAAKIAQAYDKMKHAPGDPVVAEAYQNLITQTAAQYRALEAAGYEFYLVDDSNDPYAGNPWNAMRDLRANKRMAVYATEAGFGSDESTTVDTSENPLLSDTGITWRFGKDGPMKRVLANDLFRAVHDAFGHGIEGAGFRARGEENAWQAHVRLFRGSAVGALTSETRGQNSWLNFGPHGETNKTAKVFDTVFAEQKTGLMPEWTWLDGRAGNAGDHINPRESVDPDVADTSFSLRVTVAPVRVDTVPKLTKAELLKRSGSAKFIHLQQIFDDVAAAYGVKITARFPVIGGWTERGKVSLEVPEVVEFDTDDMEIGAEMAGLVAASAPELQNSALVWQDDENGPDQIITFTVANDAAATAIAKDWNRGKVPAFSYDVANRRFTLVLKSPDDEMHGHVEAFIKKATKKGSISVGEIPTQGQGRAEFPSDERGRYESIAGEARVRASKLPAGQQQEALNEVVSRAERRIKKQAAAAKVARKAKKVLKSLPVPPESAAKIDQELGSIKFDTIRDYGLWLDARFKENTEVGAYEVGSQEGITNGGTTLAYDIIDGLSTDGSGMGWYDERVQETFRELMKIFPEFSEDPNAMTVFIGALAATSQGNNVILNFKYARKVYESYKKNGVLPTDTKFAAAKKPINDNLATMNSIIAEYGLDGFREFMDKEVTGGQLKEMFGAAPDGVTLSEIVRGNRVLGPKIGSFFNNLRGRFDTITMDLWYTRTMHRYVGESVLPLDTPKSKKMVAAFRAELNKPGTRTYGLDMKEANRGGEHTVRAAVKLFTRWSQKNEYAKKGYAKFADGYAIEKAARTIQIHASMKAAPQNKTERGWFEAIVLNAQQKLKDLGFKLTVADMQAIVWYREKNLFLDHGVAKGAAKPADYLDGAMVSRRDAEDQLDDMEEELSDNEDSTFSLVSKEDVVFGLTGVPQNEEQSLQADAEKIRSKAQDATAELVRRIRMGETLPTRVKRAKRTAESSMAARLLIPITGRLHRFAPTLAARLRRFEFDTGRAIKADFDKIKPFVDAFAKLGQNEALILDLALKNGDTQTRDQILQAFDLREAYAEVQAVLADTRKRGLAAGYEIGELTDYFPRKVMDLDGLRAHYYGKPEGGVVDRAVKEASKKAALMGRVLTDEERMEVVNRTLQGLGRKGSIPGNFKGRKTDVVDVDANAFYADSIQALLGYIDSTNAAIEKRRFFGNYAVDTPTISGVKSSKKLALDASIGGLVDSLVSSGELDGQSQREVIAILEGRFNQGITSGVIKMFKTIGYITTMGQVTSALTQLGDLAFSIYESGVWDTAIAAGTAVAGKSKVTKETMGIENIAEEFRDKTKMNRALEMTFKLTGLSYIDRIGKETLVNAKLRSMQREAKKGKLSPKTIARINTSFGEAQGAQVVADLAAGKESSDVLFAVYSTLADYQPISLSEYPESYLTNPNGRVFYMLKTFTLKQLEAFRREGIDMMVTGNASQKAQGMANLIRLMGVLYLINVPVDWLKDWLMGRDPQLSDLMVDNLFKLSGVSRWHLWNFRYRQNPIESVALLALPPAPFIQFPVMDLFDSWSKIEDGDEIKPGDFDFWRILPFAGSPYYWHFGAGADKIQKRREEREGSKRNR